MSLTASTLLKVREGVGYPVHPASLLKIFPASPAMEDIPALPSPKFHHLITEELISLEAALPEGFPLNR